MLRQHPLVQLTQSNESIDNIRILTNVETKHSLLINNNLCASVQRKLASRFCLSVVTPSLQLDQYNAYLIDCRAKEITCAQISAATNCQTIFALVDERSYLPLNAKDQDAKLELITESELNSDILSLRLTSRLRALKPCAKQPEEKKDVIKENAYEILQTLIKHSTDWMVVKDLDHRFVLVTDRFLKSEEKELIDVIGKNDLEIGTPEELVLGDTVKEWSGYWPGDDRAIALKESIETEQMIIRENAFEQTREHVSRVPIKNEAGDVVALLVCVTQVNTSNINGDTVSTLASRQTTENSPITKQLDEKRTRAEIQNLHSQPTIKRKNNFIATASHDLRQPLHAIGFFIEALEQEIENTEQKKIISKIRQSSRDLSELLNSILDISKLDANAVPVNKSHFCITDLLQSIEDEFKIEANKKLVNLHVNSNNSAVHTDSLLLSRVLKILVNNAVKYTSSGSINLMTEVDGDHLIIRVKDSGPGIPKEQYQSVFTEYHQITDQQSQPNFGHGLGLSIVKRLVELLQIDLSLDSEIDQGTQFSLTVPLSNTQKNECDKSTLTENQMPESFSLMVVDDNSMVLEAMEKTLTGMNCDAYTAQNISEALEIIAELEELPDLLIVDYQLDDGITGDVAIAEICTAANKVIPAIIITGNTNSTLVRKAAESVYRVLSKPVNPDVLLRTIRSAVYEQNQTIHSCG